MTTPTQYHGRPWRVSAVAEILDFPILLTGFFRDFFARHFASETTIEQPALQQLLWQEGERTKILVESIHRWDPRTTELRPAIIIKRGAYKNRRGGVGDRKQVPGTDHLGNRHYLTFWVGSHTLFCIGSTGGQAEALATEVRRELTEFAPLILETFELLRFQVVEVGAIAELEEATENFVVPVTVGYAFQERWQLLQQAPRLKRISLSMLLDA